MKKTEDRDIFKRPSMLPGQEFKPRKEVRILGVVVVNSEKVEVDQWIVSRASAQFYWREGGMLEHYQER